MRRVGLYVLAAGLGIAAAIGMGMFMSSRGYQGNVRLYGVGETDGSFINGIVSGIVGLALSLLTANYGTALTAVKDLLVKLHISHALTPAQQSEQFDRVKWLSSTYVPPPTPTPPVTP